MSYLFLDIGYKSPNAFHDIIFVLDFAIQMDCSFIEKLFHHMVVTSDKISGRRSLILAS